MDSARSAKGPFTYRNLDDCLLLIEDYIIDDYIIEDYVEEVARSRVVG